MGKKYFNKKTFFAFVLLIAMFSQTHISHAQNTSSVMAEVQFNGSNYPINVAQDKTVIFEKKYGAHTFQDKLISESMLLFAEIIIFLLLLKLYQTVNHKYLNKIIIK